MAMQKEQVGGAFAVGEVIFRPAPAVTVVSALLAAAAGRVSLPYQSRPRRPSTCQLAH